MFKNANHLVFELAKDLRRNMTYSETILWQYLKSGIKGLKFRRQHPIGVYVADFYCHKLKLIVEVDGSIHQKPEIVNYDEMRQKDLENWGYKVIRFTNKEIEINAEAVLAKLEDTVEHLNKNLIIN